MHLLSQLYSGEEFSGVGGLKMSLDLTLPVFDLPSKCTSVDPEVSSSDTLLRKARSARLVFLLNI